MSNIANNKKAIDERLTPSELVHRHMLNPDEKITDDDIARLKIDTSFSDEPGAADELREELKDKNDDEDKPMLTPYDMLK